MRVFRVFKCASVVLATWGIVFPVTHLQADDQKKVSRPVVKVTAANSVLDARLSKDGVFSGRVIDHGGTAAVGSQVIVRQGKNKVAEVTTDRLGNFAVPNLKSGQYEVCCGATVGNYRIWTEKAAPPSSMPHALLVLGENGARGQYGLTSTIAGENLGLILLCATTGLALAAMVVAIHAENIADAANLNSQSP